MAKRKKKLKMERLNRPLDRLPKILVCLKKYRKQTSKILKIKIRKNNAFIKMYSM